MTHAKRLLILSGFILGMLLAVLMTQPQPASAQCAVRSDWPTYTVVRGDTLFRIARRFGTNTATLASANCLANTNLIFAGQVLRVPPGGSTGNPPPPSPIGTVTTGATFQPFENGFMIWRVDNNSVSVYYGITSGNAQTFSDYGSRPVNTAVPPTGRYSPVLGFGKVWANYANVRPTLGWATGPERGFTALFQPVGRQGVNLILPDGRLVFISSGTWQISAPQPQPIPQPTPVTINAPNSAYQSYENGFMVWGSNDQLIYMFQNTGSVSVFPVANYGNLPDNPVTDATPAGRVRPVRGFGRVWGNTAWVRTALGWATANEQGYNITFRNTSSTPVGTICMNLPDGRNASVSVGASGPTVWTFVATCG